VTDADGEPADIALTAASAEQAIAELISRGYEKMSDTRAVRRRADGTVRETVRINEGISGPMDYLGRTVTVNIDRPKGSAHPEHPDMIYGVNYGSVENGILMPDGEETDAYVLGIGEPVGKFTGTVAAVLRRLDDDEDKLIVVPEGTVVTREQIRRETYFCEKYFDGVIYTAV